ncbi:MAG: lipid-A-disaccharide synthase-related protein [Cyanobacteriota bacterium]|nr:lipid-A-disaccharide synthase-related protein [Cyanobacteriota bacterium]
MGAGAARQGRDGDLLVISNGHGEDLNGSLICDALQAQAPQLRLAALPIVGGGGAYRRRGLPLLVQGRDLPSGGMVYQGMNLWRDLASGWLSQTLAQIGAAWRQGCRYRLVLSVGDHVPLLFAWLSGRPTVVFLVSTSSYYEGRLRLSPVTRWLCNRQAVRLVLTRDAFTARDLQAQGLLKARFLGYPIMDPLGTAEPAPAESDPPDSPPLSIALLPGSRFPEAQANLALMLQVCERLVRADPHRPWCFEAAVVPGTNDAVLQHELAALGWQDRGDGLLRSASGAVQVRLRSDAFAATLRRARLVLGMAGTAVEQAVGLGKPVVQLVGRGPQFSYAFAEAQMRLLGEAVFTVGDRPAGRAELDAACALVLQLLADADLPALCHQCGLERVGPAGGSAAIADALVAELGQPQL